MHFHSVRWELLQTWLCSLCSGMVALYGYISGYHVCFGYSEYLIFSVSIWSKTCLSLVKRNVGKRNVWKGEVSRGDFARRPPTVPSHRSQGRCPQLRGGHRTWSRTEAFPRLPCWGLRTVWFRTAPPATCGHLHFRYLKGNTILKSVLGHASSHTFKGRSHLWLVAPCGAESETVFPSRQHGLALRRCFPESGNTRFNPLPPKILPVESRL